MNRIDLYHRQTLIARLDRLVRLRRSRAWLPRHVSVAMLDRAIDAAALDCCDLGAAGVAREILSLLEAS